MDVTPLYGLEQSSAAAAASAALQSCIGYVCYITVLVCYEIFNAPCWITGVSKINYESGFGLAAISSLQPLGLMRRGKAHLAGYR